MFVSKIAEVDFFLSQINVLLSKVNEKFDECPDNSRSVILPRIHHIVSELEWMMSLSTKGSQSEDEEDGNCTYSGALSPPLSSRSSDVESLTWDNQDFYRLYYEDDADDEEEEEDYDEEKSENDDHGPIQFSTSSLIESSNAKVNIEAKKCDEVAENEIQIGEAAHVGEDADDEKKFISMMSATIQKLAPGSTYHVTRPRQYKVDLSQVNSRFLGNIPRPKEHPVLGCMTEEEAEAHVNRYRIWKPEWKWGFMTDCGIVPVPEEPVYGHVWSPSYREWILHAIPDDGSGPPPPRHRGGRFRG